MRLRALYLLCTVTLGLTLWACLPSQASAQFGMPNNSQPLNRFYYYPYYYYPHNYWPTMSPRWPEPVNAPYQKPPAYMAYPPFLEPHWRYEMFTPQKYYRGSHFWLDQF